MQDDSIVEFNRAHVDSEIIDKNFLNIFLEQFNFLNEDLFAQLSMNIFPDCIFVYMNVMVEFAIVSQIQFLSEPASSDDDRDNRQASTRCNNQTLRVCNYG